MKQYRVTKLIVLLLTSIWLTSCSSTNSKVGGILNLDTDLSITFEVDPDINPDEDNRPSPLFVRMYQLKSPKMFNKADFINLYERDKEVLGAELISKHKLKRFKPGESREEPFVLDENTIYIGLFAEFLNYRSATYKLIIPVTANNIISNSATIQISGNRIIDPDNSAGKNQDSFDFDKAAKQAGEAAEDAGKAAEQAEKAKALF